MWSGGGNLNQYPKSFRTQPQPPNPTGTQLKPYTLTSSNFILYCSDAHSSRILYVASFFCLLSEASFWGVGCCRSLFLKLVSYAN